MKIWVNYQRWTFFISERFKSSFKIYLKSQQKMMIGSIIPTKVHNKLSPCELKTKKRVTDEYKIYENMFQEFKSENDHKLYINSM